MLEGTSGPWCNLVDYILGITHEIWESRQVERIHDYYSHDCLIYTLGGIIRGAGTVVRNTHETLAAFPDRLLLGDAVVWSRESPGRFYSSHRISSPMTNLGVSAFGPATGRRVSVVTIADCLVENGLITTEWLVRDNYGLVRQLGLEPREIAARAAAQAPAAEFAAWLQAERERVGANAVSPRAGIVDWADDAAAEFAGSVLLNTWSGGDARGYARHYHPYAVLHDSAPVASGRVEIERHDQRSRAAFADLKLRIDHVCVRPADGDGREVAARWALTARHQGEALGVAPTDQQVYILGITHWKLVAGRIAAQWSIYDRLALMAQLMRAV